ncbi:hypothetical protein EBQ24_08880 [Allofranklinella schreckenbergeri]|uniref:Bacteriophage CI repressor N-terminal domain-containing protein n=1 Tax=Allofranklinella schreckenbergeri TaxID=1076744 RepID=A0A3M6QWP0_9BURK|nr:helix-turn-helix domain-containing protein [Allofranklinella schreckenbergeri]RMX07438.1 hypothetical protein EBQ24_08880 [Allofranklinella schreckenbergeri]
MKSTFSDEKFSRLKKTLGVREDQEAAAALGMHKAAFSARKKRGSFPEKELRALAQQRPELGLDVEYVLTGGRLTARERSMFDSARAATLAAGSLNEADRNRMLALADRGALEHAAQNARREGMYEKIRDLLGGCTDESVQLVLTLATKCFIADSVTASKK